MCTKQAPFKSFGNNRPQAARPHTAQTGSSVHKQAGDTAECHAHTAAGLHHEKLSAGYVCNLIRLTPLVKHTAGMMAAPGHASAVFAARRQKEWQPSGNRLPRWPRGRAHRWPSQWGPADCSGRLPGCGMPCAAPGLQGSEPCPALAGTCTCTDWTCLCGHTIRIIIRADISETVNLSATRDSHERGQAISFADEKQCDAALGVHMGWLPCNGRVYPNMVWWAH